MWHKKMERRINHKFKKTCLGSKAESGVIGRRRIEGSTYS